MEFSLGYLKENVGLLAEGGNWQEVIIGLDPEDIIMFESLIKSGDIFKNKARIRLSTIHGIKGGESDNVVLFPIYLTKLGVNLTLNQMMNIEYFMLQLQELKKICSYCSQKRSIVTNYVNIKKEEL